MNKNQLTFIIVALIAFTALVIGTTWTLYAIYEAPARRAAELQAETRNEAL